MLSYHSPYDTANKDASPSFMLNDLAQATSDLPVFLPSLVSKNWILNIPDYEGPEASFGAGRISGHAAIDSVRAVLAARDILGIHTDVRYAMYGYSGGSIPSEWAAELQSSYAPELDVAGVALGGLPTSLSNVIIAYSGKPEAGLAIAGIMGVSTQHPKFNKALRSELKPSGTYNKTAFLAVANYTFDESINAFSQQNIFEYFKSGLSFLQNPDIAQTLDKDGTMGYTGVPQMPLFVYHSKADENLAVSGTNALLIVCVVWARTFDMNAILLVTTSRRPWLPMRGSWFGSLRFSRVHNMNHASVL